MKKIMNIEMAAGKRAQIAVGKIANALTDGKINAEVRDDGVCVMNVEFANENEFETVLGIMKSARGTRVVIVQ